MTIPFSAFQGMKGAKPDLTKIRSLSFNVPSGMRSPVLLDQVRLEGGAIPKTRWTCR